MILVVQVKFVIWGDERGTITAVPIVHSNYSTHSLV